MLKKSPYTLKKIGPLIDLLSGFAFKSNEFSDVATTEQHIRLLRGINITENAIRNNDTIDKFWFNSSTDLDKYYLKEGDLVISMDGSKVGRNYALVSPKDLPSLLVQRVARIRAKEGLHLPFLHQLIGSKIFTDYVDSVKTSSGIPHISAKQIKEFSIPLPNIAIQQKIAEILSTVDKKIDLIDQKIAETEKLKTGLMQKLFSESVGVQDENGEWQPHTEFQDSIYGNIPKTWKLFKLNQVTDYVDYRGKTPPKVESGTFLVTAKNIKNGFIDYECSKEYIPSELYDDVMSRGKPKLGDVVFTTEAPLGNVALIDRSDVAIAQRVIKFRPKDEICLDSGYLKHFMLSTYFQKELLQNATGSTVLGVKGKRLHVMLVCLPSINEQIMIVDILNEVDRKMHFLELQKAETQQLKKGLMQKLLTGEWRVPVEETEAA
ncbi:restriction endonuclease subunit S [Shewanella algae]|uniref:restriction endonuclease subunit S n=1 Tax=Shewanella algae TaxID=38313 RepID=UPI0031F5AA0E